MLYKDNYFGKEFRQGYTENEISTARKTAFGLFAGLFSFALYFIFLLLKESVLYDTVPEIMQTSYFSTIYIYIHAAVLLHTIYFMVHYESLFFYEIKNNSWYLLVKMGHNPAIMIFAKLLALLLSVTSVYSIGFFFTAFLTFFLKYNLIVAYFPSLYITGLIDLIIISMISMALSLFVKTITNARYSIFMSVAVLHILKVISGHYSILSNRVSMQSLVNLVDLNRTLYVPIAFTIISICSYICVAMARNLSMYYNIPYNSYEDILPTSTKVVLIDSVTGQSKPLVDIKK